MRVEDSAPLLGGYKANLPPEILTVIVKHVQAFTSFSLNMQTLWSCCLLSRAWYSAAVPYLYESPRLRNRNFDKFARTICPPVNSHIRHIGLESFVRQLDMGNLAYESSRSLTARLLRRTRHSLETFVAPAVSFSIACLAPLSKCAKLRSLDLSRDFYDISLAKLLHAVGGLEHLTNLSLPKSAMSTRCQLKVATTGESSWPTNLTYLQFNDYLPKDPDWWRELLASWPACLASVAFENCFSWEPLFLLHRANSRAVHVRSLSVGMRHEEDGFPIEILLTCFPSLLSLAIPVPPKFPEFTVSNFLAESFETGKELNELLFRSPPDTIQPRPKLGASILYKCIETNPRLVRIEIPESCLDIDHCSPEDLDRMERLMTSRVTKPEEGVGVYLIEE